MQVSKWKRVFMGLYEGVIALQNDLDIPLLFLYFFYSFEMV